MSEANTGDGSDGEGEPEEKVGILREMGSGFTFIWQDRNLMMIAILVCAQTIVAGATVVLGVVLAYGINRSKGRTRAEKNRTDQATLKNYREEDGH